MSADVPEGQQSCIDILIETIETVAEKGIARLIIFCYDAKGKPVGFISNVADPIQRLGLIEVIKPLLQSEE